MAINLNDNIAVLGAKPTDARYLNNLTPYADCAAVTSALAANKRYTGLTVNIAGEEYWFAEGIDDGDLVAKESSISTTAITGATNGLSKSGQRVVLGGDLTGNTIIGGAHTMEFNVSTVNITGNTAIKNSTLTLDTVAAGATTNPIMVLDSGVVKCVTASSFDVTACNGLHASSNNVMLGGALTGDTTLSGAHTFCLSSLTAFNATATNIALAGAVAVTGAETISSCLGVSGNTDITGTLDVGNTLTLDAVGAGDASDALLVLDSTGAVQCIPQTDLDVTACNGLHASSNNVMLGGALTGDTTLSGAHTFCLSSLTAFNATATNINLAGAGCITGAFDISDTLDVGNTLTLDTVAAGTTSNSILVLDSSVVKCVAASSYYVTACSGLHASNNNVMLGGDLTGNTEIGGSYTLGAHNDVINLTGDTGVNLGGALTFRTLCGCTNDIVCVNTTTGAVGVTSISSLGGITGGTNGLTDDGNQNLKIGAALIENTCITGAFNMQLLDLNGVCLSTCNTNDVAVNVKDCGSLILKAQCGTTASSTDTGDAVAITLDANATAAMLITDNSTGQFGIQYATDYSTNFCDNSLVNKLYVDSVATGLKAHEAALVATDSQIILSGLTVIDGIQLQEGDRVLVKDQDPDDYQNGIYSATTGYWGRTSDYDFTPAGEVGNGDLVPVTTGTTNESSIFIQTEPDPIVSGDSINFSQFSKLIDVTGGDGITVNAVGTNREVEVDLGASQCGLAIVSNALELDYNIFTNAASSGLTCSNGYVSVNASNCGPPHGTCIPVLFDSNCNLVVDSDDFSYTCGANGLTKVGCNVVLGGFLTGTTEICIEGSTDLKFTDNRSSTVGLEYSGQYKDDFGKHSLVDKDFVTGCTSAGIISAANGLCVTPAQNVSLGGVLTGDTLIDTNNAQSLTISCGGAAGIGVAVAAGGGVVVGDIAKAAGPTPYLSFDGETVLQGGGNVMEIVTTNTLVGPVASGIHIGAGDTECLTLDVVNAGLFRIDAAGNFFEDASGNGYGIQYCTDYKATFQNNSLVDKCYVDCVAAAGAVSAENGLTKTGANDIILGGLLTGHTEIDSSGTKYSVIFGSNSSTTNNVAGSALLGGGSHIICAGSTNGVAVGGCFARVDGAHSAVVGGNLAQALGHTSAALGGYSNATCGNFSAIIAGTSNTLETGNTSSVLIGGQAITVPADNYACHVIVPNLAMFTTPVAGAGSDVLLVWNSTDKKVKCVTQASVGVTANNGIVKSGAANLYLGGTLTGDTKIEMATFSLNIAGATTTVIGDSSVALGGYGHQVSGCTATVIGGWSQKALGNYSSIFGGYSNQARGSNATILGGSYAYACGNDATIIGGSDGTIYATSRRSTILGANNAYLHADCSVIIGGKGNTLNTGNTYSVVLGGQGITVPVDALPDHAIVPSLAMFTTPSAGSGSDVLLVWNSTDKKVKCVTQGSVGITSATNGVCVAGTQFVLGGELTGNTIIGGDTVNSLELGAGNSMLSALDVCASTIGLSGTTTVTGTLTLNNAGSGSVTDDVLTITSGGEVQKIDSSSLGEDNNRYIIDRFSTSNPVPTTGYTVLVSPTSATTLTLTASPVEGQAYKIKDAAGDALTYNITVDGNGKNIDGGASATINTDYGALEIVFDTTLDEWYTLSFIN